MQLINLPYDDEMIESYGGIDGINTLLKETHCDSIEWIWGGRKVNTKLPENLTQGYHLTFYSDWLDFYLGDTNKLLQKFDNWDTIKQMYGAVESDILNKNYEADLKRASQLNSKYVVFHVSDVSIEEGYSYAFEHSDKAVLDASIEIINSLKVDDNMDFLIENLWWAGFRFSDIESTKYILDRIKHKNKGIMLDTGHLLNTNIKLRTEKEAVDFILQKLEEHKEILPFIKGIHLNKSLSGEYVEKNTGKNFIAEGNSYFEKFSNSYSHILKIDQHKPFESDYICKVMEKILPKYIVHELSGSNLEKRKSAIKIQRKSIWNMNC